MQQILASHQVTMEIKEISYDQWHKGEIESDIWLNSANFTLPLDFSLLRALVRSTPAATLYSARLASRRSPLAQWRDKSGELVPATGRQ